MVIPAIFIILLFLILVQVSFLPLNLAFIALVAFFLFAKGDFSYWWVLVAAILLGLFANINLGIVVIAFTLAFLVIQIAARFLPENQLTKASLVIFALFLSEISLLFFKDLLT